MAEDGIKVIHLNRFVVCRDPMGSVTEIVVEEEVYPDALPVGLYDDIDEEDGGYESGRSSKTIKLYTHVEYEDGKVHWYQEAKGKEIPGSHGMCDQDVNPWIPLRFNRVDSEEYGRSYIEEYYGDLLALESLYQAIIEGAAAAAKVLFLVNPNGTTRPRTLANAENGAIVQGNAADVTVIQTQKAQDLSIANSTIERIEGRLQFAFLLMLPSVLLSGFVFPRNEMPTPIYLLSFAIPVTYFIEALRGIVLRGADAVDLLPQALALGVCTTLILALAVARFRKQLA